MYVCILFYVAVSIVIEDMPVMWEKALGHAAFVIRTFIPFTATEFAGITAFKIPRIFYQFTI
jgi:hypothetical protein